MRLSLFASVIVPSLWCCLWACHPEQEAPPRAPRAELLAEEVIDSSASSLFNERELEGSFVLLDEECEALTEPALTRLYDGVLRANGLASNGAAGRVFPMDGYATATPENPMIVTFYDESRVRELARTAGLEVHAVYHGSWSRMDGGPAFQDLVVLARR